MTLHVGLREEPSSSQADADETTPTTSVVMWPCDECGAQFTRRYKLERHQRTHCQPRIIVVTPSGLRLTAQQMTLHDAGDIMSVSEVTTDPSDLTHLYQLSG